jgi:hypothetical protein
MLMAMESTGMGDDNETVNVEIIAQYSPLAVLLSTFASSPYQMR